MITVLQMSAPFAFAMTQIWEVSSRTTAFNVPEPYQSGIEYPGMEGPWMVYISDGRWSTRKPQPIAPLEHPMAPGYRR